MHKSIKEDINSQTKAVKRGVIAWMLSVISLAVLVAVIVCSFKTKETAVCILEVQEYRPC